MEITPQDLLSHLLHLFIEALPHITQTEQSHGLYYYY